MAQPSSDRVEINTSDSQVRCGHMSNRVWTIFVITGSNVTGAAKPENTSEHIVFPRDNSKRFPDRKGWTKRREAL